MLLVNVIAVVIGGACFCLLQSLLLVLFLLVLLSCTITIPAESCMTAGLKGLVQVLQNFQNLAGALVARILVLLRSASQLSSHQLSPGLVFIWSGILGRALTWLEERVPPRPD